MREGERESGGGIEDRGKDGKREREGMMGRSRMERERETATDRQTQKGEREREERGREGGRERWNGARREGGRAVEWS